MSHYLERQLIDFCMTVARPPPALITELWVYLLFRWPTDKGVTKSASSTHRAACYESERQQITVSIRIRIRIRFHYY